ncbi:hypothetical protein ONJ23_27975, partial [Salmonella enterica subsp. enterica serovar Virginia]|nr:hypothetical protein [Salmonella enterica subsp. enterica serovar Virginia]
MSVGRCHVAVIHFALILLCAQAGAASLSDIQVSNGEQQARITLSFIGEPEYAYSQ